MFSADDVVEPHVDLFVDPDEEDLWVVVLYLYFLSNDSDCCLEGSNLWPDVLLDLCLSKALSVDDNQVGDSLRCFVVVLSPVLKD